jgi:F0F1-type ATP synthase assembly protein I
MPASEPRRSPPRTPATLFVVGSEMFGFALVGVMIDFALGTIRTVPWATLIFAPLGLIAGFVHLIRLTRR